jgi:aryl-alcohol dehydrogenase-like predicted oxidoreductase
MNLKKLGRTDLAVSELCLGTMTYGQQTSREDGFAQMDYALAQGINFFDTAELYSIPPKASTMGATETIIGEWFTARKNRDKIILATKVVGRSPMNWFRQDGSTSRLNKAQMVEAIEGSLRRLKTDYIDLYQLHFPDRVVSSFGSIPTHFEEVTPAQDETPIFEILETLDGFVRQGKVRHIGLSNESPWGTMTFLHESKMRGLARVASVQNAYNLLNRVYETGMAEITMREDVGLLAYSPLGQGYLTGKYLDGARPADSRSVLFNRGQRYEKAGTDTAIKAYLALANDLGVSLNSLALAFVTTRSFVTSNIIGATTMAQLKAIMPSLDLKITPEILAAINAIHQIHQNPAP